MVDHLDWKFRNTLGPISLFNKLHNTIKDMLGY